MFALGQKFAPPVKIERKPPPNQHVSYSDFVKKIKNNEVEQVVVNPNNSKVVFLNTDGTIQDSTLV